MIEVVGENVCVFMLFCLLSSGKLKLLLLSVFCDIVFVVVFGL